MDTTIPETGATTDADGPAAASALVAACEQAWQAIQDRHPEVPHAVIVLGTGVERGRLVKLGHWWAGRWIADGEPRGEVLLAGEALHLPATDVFEVLLHEAAHGLNAARHIKDTSRGGRYHNRRFQQTAESVGLTVAKLGPYGWAHTSLTADTAAAYGEQIQGIATAMRIARTLTRPPATINGPENDDGRGPSSGDNRTSTGPARCGCGRRMRMAPSVLAQGPVICGLCHEPFATEPRAATRALAVDHHQFERTEPPAAGSEHAWRADARQTIVAALNDEIGRQQFETVAAWYGQRRAGHDPTLTALEGRDREALERLARALLVLDGTLHPPTITIGGREFAVGESIRFADESDPAQRDRRALPIAGMFGTVTEIDPAGRLGVEVPIAGRYRLDADAPIAAALRHAYTDPPSPLAAPRLQEAHGNEVDVGCEL